MRFGTDGVRGEANIELTPEVALALGRAAASVLRCKTWFIGWDTRLSSSMLVSAFGAGIASGGASVVELGVIPTAGVAFACSREKAPGAMVTASHNPFKDNGIKIFNSDGAKLSVEEESEIERLFQSLMEGSSQDPRDPETGLIIRRPQHDMRLAYEQWLVAHAKDVAAAGLRIGVDCANGAAYEIGPVAISATGADVSVIGAGPNGVNINSGCGSTDLDQLRKLVVDSELDLGLAFDGDADRLLAVDNKGAVVDGDQIMAMLVRTRLRSGTLAGSGIVVTQWSNLGLIRSLKRDGVRVEICEVGDRAVAQAMERTGFGLGGEQSGHIILRERLPVGDGISTAIELIKSLVASRVTLSEYAEQVMTKLPQKTENVKVSVPPKQVVEELAEEVERVNSRLDGRGRLVLRASGTEKIVRVMVEADNPADISEILDQMSTSVALSGQGGLILP